MIADPMMVDSYRKRGIKRTAAGEATLAKAAKPVKLNIDRTKGRARRNRDRSWSFLVVIALTGVYAS